VLFIPIISRDFLQLYKIQTIPAIKLIASNGEVADEGARVKIEKNHTDAEAAKKIVRDWKTKLGIE
jgi:molybdopterin-biosynthesis enzyme MoeA-like protein